MSSSTSFSSPDTLANRTNVFDNGSYPTALLRIKAESHFNNTKTIPPPKPLLIGTPSCLKGGEFPVLLMLHGYVLYNDFYSQLIHHVASHGFVVIAPQLYSVAGPDSRDEIEATAAVINWLSEGLKDVLPSNVQPNLHKLALSGHSRGGKVAFALALNKITASPLKISALIGIDPVDGMGKGNQTPPPVLTYVPQSFDLNGMPVLVIGSGFGEIKKNPLFPPCAPKGVNHENFFEECQSPAWYFLVKDYGHLDVLDDDTKGVRGITTYCLCKNGKCREPMRKFVGGVIVAFLDAYIQGDDTKLNSIRDHDETVPVVFDKVDVRNF
ncbi:chlorophyllase-2, chloroplastic-like [Chenopodium quinoa]|uniref:chlorophyllase-2, chloroplastic-like n=1 Tax=Chenopodium quinoa TaxID=63459 RepID=UPI000B76ED83|nr:chlorophyllase-2, chloroplastic-like [Chenopodium quinoa]